MTNRIKRTGFARLPFQGNAHRSALQRLIYPGRFSSALWNLSGRPRRETKPARKRTDIQSVDDAIAVEISIGAGRTELSSEGCNIKVICNAIIVQIRITHIAETIPVGVPLRITTRIRQRRSVARRNTVATHDPRTVSVGIPLTRVRDDRTIIENVGHRIAIEIRIANNRDLRSVRQRHRGEREVSPLDESAVGAQSDPDRALTAAECLKTDQ